MAKHPKWLPDWTKPYTETFITSDAMMIERCIWCLNLSFQAQVQYNGTTFIVIDVFSMAKIPKWLPKY